ncbi:hypothetical protein TNCV_2829511 [Trichonephila clavipes]|nr:hypothetical protein TNCV_2829511 [Trichonephila clavipes]
MILQLSQNKRFSVVISNLQHYVSLLELWLTDWKIKVNASKSACLMFTSRPRLPVGLTPVQIFGQPVPWVRVAKYLGLFLDAKLTFAHHIEQTRKKRRLFMPFSNGLSPEGVNLRSGISQITSTQQQDNSLWAVQKFFKNKRSGIPSLHCTTGTAITDKQKADILAESILTNFTENERQNNDFDDDDEIVNNTVNAFLSHPPPPTAETAYPSEIISYIKSSNPKKAPGKDGISNRMTKNFTLKAILILTILVNKILKHNYFPKIWKEAIIFPILKPGKSKNNPASYRPISFFLP